MGHAGPGLGRRLPGLQPLDLGVAPQPLDRRPHRLPAHEPRGRVRRRLHHVRAPEDGFLARKVCGKIVQPVRELPDRLAGYLHLMSGDGGDQRLALDVALGFAPPAPVAHLGVVVVGLAGPCQLVHPRHARGVAQGRNPQLSGLRHDRLASLRPEGLQVLRHPLDAGELGVGAILDHPHLEALLKLPGHAGPEQRPSPPSSSCRPGTGGAPATSRLPGSWRG